MFGDFFQWRTTVFRRKIFDVFRYLLYVQYIAVSVHVMYASWYFDMQELVIPIFCCFDSSTYRNLDAVLVCMVLWCCFPLCPRTQTYQNVPHACIPGIYSQYRSGRQHCETFDIRTRSTTHTTTVLTCILGFWYLLQTNDSSSHTWKPRKSTRVYQHQLCTCFCIRCVPWKAVLSEAEWACKQLVDLGLLTLSRKLFASWRLSFWDGFAFFVFLYFNPRACFFCTRRRSHFFASSNSFFFSTLWNCLNFVF